MMSLTVPAGEFLAVIGPNGVGKTSLLRVLLGLQPLTRGRVEVLGGPPHRGNRLLGYVPQHSGFDRDLPMRGWDLVALGLKGDRWGFSLSPREAVQPVEEALSLVGAADYADAPIGRLSGGEQQRLRIAQALIAAPRVLLFDEPLTSLDLYYQHSIVQLLSDWGRRHRATVIFVTHDINPVLSALDRVLLLAGGGWAVGRADDVVTSDTLSRLYDSPVDVLRVGGRVVIVGAELGGHEPHPHALVGR
jgi:zinc/manganese transport system ATP-binding protein